MIVDRGDAVNLVRDLRPYGDNALKKITLNGLWCLFDAIENMDAALRASPPEAVEPQCYWDMDLAITICPKHLGPLTKCPNPRLDQRGNDGDLPRAD